MTFKRTALLGLWAAGIAHASGPVHTKLTVCVLDGMPFTLAGNPIHTTLDLSAFQGQKLALEGDLYPGDSFVPAGAPKPLGACTADEKLALLPALAWIYKDAKAVPVPAPSTRAALATLDCAARPPDACYELVRISKNNGKPVVLHTPQHGSLIGHVFVDSTYLYWSEGDIGAWKMMRQPKAGGAITQVSEGSLRGELVRGADGFYGETSRGFVALPDEKPPRVIEPPDTVLDIAYDQNTLYWIEEGPEGSSFIKSMPTAGGAPSVLGAGQPNATVPFIANGMLYWSNINVPPMGGAQIMGVPIGGGVPRVLVPTSNDLFPWALVADAKWLYWVEWKTGRGGYSVYRAPVTGGERQLLGTSPTEPMIRDNRDRIELDAKNIYWNARQSVARMPKAGGPVEELVRLVRGDVMTFAMDDTDVYLAVVIFGS